MKASFNHKGTGGYGFFKVIGYRTTLSGARNALGYAAFRSLAAREGGARVFDDRMDTADVRSFSTALSDPITAHPRVAKAFHALFSLPVDAHQRAGIVWPEVVREVMRDYELQTGRRLHWMAVEHQDKRHPHVHLILKATYQDQTGRERRLRLGRPDIARMRALVARSLEARGLEPERLRTRLKQRAMEQTRAPGRDLAGGMLGWLRRQIHESQRVRNYEQEMALQEQRRRRPPERGR